MLDIWIVLSFGCCEKASMGILIIKCFLWAHTPSPFLWVNYLRKDLMEPKRKGEYLILQETV